MRLRESTSLRSTQAAQLRLAVLIAAITLTAGSNWAQISGAQRQNVATSSPSPWSKRWGFAFAIIDHPDVKGIDPSLVPPEKQSMMFVMGGDDWSGDAVAGGRADSYRNDFQGRLRDPNYDPTDYAESPPTGRGDYRNDVWMSTGAEWRVFNDYRAGNGFGEPLPRLVSTTNWTKAADWEGIPDDVDGWREYMGCCHELMQYPCREEANGFCVDGDPYLASRRWSPRRGHMAVTVYDPAGFRPPTIVVMGGRARSFERMLGTELAGGFLGNVFDSKTTARQKSILMSDVWVSTNGVAWDYTNGGCYAPQETHAKLPGSQVQRCDTDEDCYKGGMGDASCVDAPPGSWSQNKLPRRYRGMCVCNHWSPRERFAAAAYNGKVYVSGGIFYKQLFLCGDYACGGESGVFLDDLWMSDNYGRFWVMVAEHSTVNNAYGRADHVLIHSSQRWWIIGGRGRDEEDKKAMVDVLYSDSYASDEGAFWSQNVTESVWTPRAAMSAVVDDKGVIYMMGGDVEYPVIDPASIILSAAEQVALAAAKAPTNVDRGVKATQAIDWPGEEFNGLQVVTNGETWLYFPDSISLETDTNGYDGWGPHIWFDDFGPIQARQHAYVWPDMPLDHSYLNFSSGLVDTLNQTGLTTLRELADVSAEIVYAYLTPIGPDRKKDLPPYLPDICSLRARAQFLVDRCKVQYRPYDDEGFRLGPYAPVPVYPPAPDESPTGCENQDNSIDYTENDVVCRQAYTPRRSFGAGFMGGRLYVVGGWEAWGYYANDAWYRDELAPVTSFKAWPGDKTSESVFEFTSSEPSCVYEMRVFDAATGSMLRNWVRVPTPYDGIALNKPHMATRVEIRAIDPAGNRDNDVEAGRNSYTWTYIPPFPTLMVVLVILFGLLFLFGSVYGYRRWRQKKAMERYMARRLARKLKQQGDDDGERKKKRKKKKKGQGGKGGAGQDSDMMNRFREILRQRAEKRIQAEYQALARRKTAKETYGFNATIAERVSTAERDARVGDVNKSYQEEAMKARERLKERARVKQMTTAQAGLDEDDLEAGAQGGARGASTMGAVGSMMTRSVGGLAASDEAYMQKALQSDIARKAAASNVSGLGALMPGKAWAPPGGRVALPPLPVAGSDTDATLPGQVGRDAGKPPTGRRESSTEKRVWRPSGPAKKPGGDAPGGDAWAARRGSSSGPAGRPPSQGPGAPPPGGRGGRAPAGAPSRAGPGQDRQADSDGPDMLPGQL